MDVWKQLEQLESLAPHPEDANSSWTEQFPFDFLGIGLTGEVDVVSTERKPPGLSIFSTVELGLPPLIPFSGVDVEETFLQPKQAFDADFLRKTQREISREMDLHSLLFIETMPSTLSLEVSRDITTGAILGYHEVPLDDASQNARNSNSLLRDPAPYGDFVRGKNAFKPFKPGGIEYSEEEGDFQDILDQQGGQILTVPPGFERGLFSTPETDLSQGSGSPTVPAEEAKVISMGHVMSVSDDWWFKEGQVRKPTSSKPKMDPTSNLVENTEEMLELPKGPVHVESSREEGEGVVDALPEKVNFTVTAKAEKPRNEDRKHWAVQIDMTKPFTNFHDVVPNMAMKYPFELDTFQKHAVYHLENGNSVFVAAHTSAGKTVVAEYAIALAAKHMTRAIYTSPIKALSNQKFRDFKDTFEDVGLLTGDVQIKPEASCLIMTTEILRSMLYRGADLIRDVEWVIFDEVHYINDAERGVVWEEVLIMLPAHVGLILLSATVPNTMELADWIGRTKRKEVFVVSTFQRPVPLEYHLFYNKEIYKIVDSKRNFIEGGYKKGLEVYNAKNAKNKGAPPRPTEQGLRNEWVTFIEFLKAKTLLPVVAFTFSRKKCEQLANSLNNVDLNSSSEKSEVHVFVQNSLKRLKGTDRELPQVLRTKDLLARGIAVHHSGLLPIIKEMVEMMFSRGLVKLLFATETFAMGVNMPARTVVFQGLRKPDGKNFRDLLPGEFTQMAGRAGRRGLDTVGVVIFPVFENYPEAGTLHQVMLGQPTRLESRFRLTYIMILNLLRVEELKVEDMMKRSFSEFGGQKELPQHQQQLKENKEKYNSFTKLACTICSPDLEEYYHYGSEVVKLNFFLQEVIMNSIQGIRSMTPGRAIIVNNASYRNTLAVVLKTNEGKKNLMTGQNTSRTFTCMIISSKAAPKNDGLNLPLPVTKLHIPDQPSYAMVEIQPHEVTSITKHRLKVDAAKVVDTPNIKEINSTFQALLQLAQENSDGIEGINPVRELKINEMDFVEKYQKKMEMTQILSSGFQCSKCPDLADHYGSIHTKKVLAEKVADLEHKMSDKNLLLLPEYEQRLRVLKDLEFVEETNTVKLKGRVACELNTCDELIVTELIFENIFTDLDASEVVALLSCFVFQEKSQSEPVLTDKLQKGKEKIQKITERLGKTQRDCGLDLAVEEYVRGLNFGLVEVVYEWARGMSFKQITDLTDVLEGSIVRCIVRLDETCRDVRNAARVIGDSVLYKKAEEASMLIKRDIVFAASLYY